MILDPFLGWLESTALSQWVVGSLSLLAFPGILTLHAIGMGFAVGLGLAIAFRVLGVAPHVPLPAMLRFMPILWAGFWLNAVSGVLLLVGYPTKALTNPVFYLKLVLIAAAMWMLVRMARDIRGGTPPVDVPGLTERRLRTFAVVSILCWTGAVTAGRLLAYTYTRLTQID